MRASLQQLLRMQVRRMRYPADRSGLYPHESHERLLDALLCAPQDTQHALHTWETQVDIGRLDLASRSLLPALHHRIAALGLQSAHADLYRVEYMRWRLLNTQQLNGAKEALRLLAAEGIACMPYKGIALVRSYYPDRGMRTMTDIDLLVAREDAPGALATLIEAGWAGKRTPDLVDLHATPLHKAGGLSLDLHWLPFSMRTSARFEEHVWGQAQDDAWDGVAMQRMSASLLLFCVIVHGARWNFTNPVRWIVDAHTLLAREAAAVDWAWLADSAAQFGLTLFLRDACRYARERHALPFPDDFLAALERQPVTKAQQREYELYARERHPLIGGVQRRYYRYHFSEERENGGFVRYQMRAWKAAGRNRVLVRAYELLTGGLG